MKSIQVDSPSHATINGVPHRLTQHGWCAPRDGAPVLREDFTESSSAKMAHLREKNGLALGWFVEHQTVSQGINPVEVWFAYESGRRGKWNHALLSGCPEIEAGQAFDLWATLSNGDQMWRCDHICLRVRKLSKGRYAVVSTLGFVWQW